MLIRYALRILAFAAFLFSAAIAQQPAKQESPDRTVQTQMNNVMYHVGNNAAVHILKLGGELVPTKPDSIPIFDDKNSFDLRVTAAEMAITPQAMANILNQFVFNDRRYGDP